MMPVALQIRFVKDFLPAALAAGTAFHMNPNMILAQAAFESGWGQSRLSTEANNFFGLTAFGSYNEYWHGARYTVTTATYTLDFRRYDTPANSFLDFARLIHHQYPSAHQMSGNPSAYAKEIAYSAYLGNDDDGGGGCPHNNDREVYRLSLVQIEQTIQAVIAMAL